MSKRKSVRPVAASTALGERNGRPPIEAIRAAAFRQFAERGYPVVTVRDIMKACGLTQGALYNHFKSKDELLHDIIASTQAELERLCQQAVNGAGGDGLFHGNPAQLWTQVIAVVVTIALAAPMTFIILKVVDALIGVRVTAEDELSGLDLSQHSESAYVLGGSVIGEHIAPLSREEQPRTSGSALVSALGKG